MLGLYGRLPFRAPPFKTKQQRRQQLANLQPAVQPAAAIAADRSDSDSDSSNGSSGRRSARTRVNSTYAWHHPTEDHSPYKCYVASEDEVELTKAADAVRGVMLAADSVESAQRDLQELQVDLLKPWDSQYFAESAAGEQLSEQEWQERRGDLAYLYSGMSRLRTRQGQSAAHA
jgi:hypothetical protein